MRTYQNYETPETFDWSVYEDGWNGKGLKPNKKVKEKDGMICYCHENYAQEAFDKYSGHTSAIAKELVPGTITKVTDLHVINDNEIMATVMNGANNIVIDLNKEVRFLNAFADANGNALSKQAFVESIQNPKFKSELLAMGLSIQVNNGEKASMWDGYVTTFMNEMKEQIAKPSKAYIAHIDGSNNGGFLVTIANIVKAFMPGSMAASNRVTDFESYIGKDMEVMVENYDPHYGFVVSRKKFLRTVAPMKIRNMEIDLENNRDTVYTGVVTGSTRFGVFVELNEFVTGMIHKSCMSEDLYNRIKDNGDPTLTGQEINVYVHEIDGTKVLLSDMPYEERKVLLEKRAAAEEAEKQQKDGKPNNKFNKDNSFRKKGEVKLEAVKE